MKCSEEKKMRISMGVHRNWVNKRIGKEIYLDVFDYLPQNRKKEMRT